MVTTNCKAYGAYTKQKDSELKGLTSTISFQPLNLLKKWQRCSLTANFFSQIQLDKIPIKNKAQIHNILSSISNEILENAIRYSYNKTTPVKMSLSNNTDKLTFEVESACHTSDAKRFERFFKKCEIKDNDSHIVELLESTERTEDLSLAISLLSITNNYHSEIGYKVTPKESDTNCTNVSVMIVLKIDKEIEQ